MNVVKQNIIDKLKIFEKSTAQLLMDLSKISDENLSMKPEKSWSILQVLSHLNSAEQASLLYMKKKIQAGDQMGKIGWMNNLQMKLTNGALATPLKWKAPSYISNPKAPENLKEMEDIWMKTRAEILDFVNDYPEKYLNKLVYKHPMGGRQNLNNAVDSFIYHQKHHLHQISRIKKSLGI
jgi:uncharacterized damage-inducible protein DinB